MGNKIDVNLELRRRWNDKYPQLPCWTGKTEKEEYRPWRVEYEKSGSNIGIRKWCKQNNIHNYILDFCILVNGKLIVAVELDGRMHSTGLSVVRDRMKSNHLQMMGCWILRFSAETALSSFDYICDQVVECLKNNCKEVYAEYLQR